MSTDLKPWQDDVCGTNQAGADVSRHRPGFHEPPHTDHTGQVPARVVERRSVELLGHSTFIQSLPLTLFLSP